MPTAENLVQCGVTAIPGARICNLISKAGVSRIMGGFGLLTWLEPFQWWALKIKSVMVLDQLFCRLYSTSIRTFSYLCSGHDDDLFSAGSEMASIGPTRYGAFRLCHFPLKALDSEDSTRSWPAHSLTLSFGGGRNLLACLFRAFFAFKETVVTDGSTTSWRHSRFHAQRFLYTPSACFLMLKPVQF